jgi:hypothetical protein
MSEAERETIRQRIKSIPGTAARWRRGAENALVTWAVLLLLFILGWQIIAWLARKTVHVEIGWHAAGTIWVVASATLGCALYAIISSVRWVKKWPDPRKDYQADLESGQVIEEFYQFTATKRFQDPEHGGLIYFLRTINDEVFVLYDYESQNLGAEGDEPLNSKFQPRAELLIVRAPKSEEVIGRQISGAALEVGEPLELKNGPRAWPEDETYCKIPWDELEKRLNRKNKKPRSR